jgi:molybdopterin-synthase adenylyltransferase
MTERHSRQSFLGPNSERQLSARAVAIVGLGGGGSHIVQQSAHLGILNFALFDPDSVEESHLNRLVGATAEDAVKGSSKLSVAKRLITGINPLAQVECNPGNWQEHHARLRHRDIIIGCLDSYRSRYELEITARRYLIPYLDIGMDVHKVNGEYLVSGQIILSMPGQLCMRCLGFLRDELLIKEAANYGAAGPRPQVVWANGILASVAMAVLAQLFTPWHKSSPSTVYLEYDGNLQTLASSNRLSVMEGKVCPHFADYRELGDPFWIPEQVSGETESIILSDEDEPIDTSDIPELPPSAWKNAVRSKFYKPSKKT